MKICEVIGNTVKVQPVVPAAVAQQQRINKVVAQRAASDTQLQPTEDEKAIAMFKYMELKQNADKQYAANTMKQAAIANNAIGRKPRP